MYEIRTAGAIVIATVVMALGTAPDAHASKEKFVRDKPHVAIDAAAETETVEQAAGEHDHSEVKSGGCKMHDMKAEGGGCKMHDMKANSGECKMHEMKARKEGMEKGCKMMQQKQKRMQMKKQSGAEHKHGKEEATD